MSGEGSGDEEILLFIAHYESCAYWNPSTTEYMYRYIRLVYVEKQHKAQGWQN